MPFQELNTQGRGLLHRYYDFNTGQWNFLQEGDFWEAIKLAHKKNILGQGAKISIVDRDFDLDIPKLKNHSVLTNENAEETFIEKIIDKILPKESHGTIVALLVLMIAPEARLELYDIGDNPEQGSKNAFKKISSSEALIINYSVGKPSDLTEFEKMGENNHCHICEMVEPAINSNKIIFAAVGNDKDKKFCPAIRHDVMSIGFQSEKSQINFEGNFETVTVTNTSLFSQSPISDFTIPESSGVLGSSFAAPLIAGATCLLDNPYDVKKYISASYDITLASWLFAQVYDSVSESTVDSIGYYFESAIKKLPHLHEKDDNYCAGCSIFTISLYINAGLYYLFKNRLDLSEQFSAVAIKLAPWSADAASFRASHLRTIVYKHFRNNNSTNDRIEILKQEAISEIERAIKINPNHQIYKVALKNMLDRFKLIEERIVAERLLNNKFLIIQKEALQLWKDGKLKKALSLFLDILDSFSNEWLKENNVFIIKDNINNLRGDLAQQHKRRGEYEVAVLYYSDILSDFAFKDEPEQKRIEITYSIGQCLVFQQKFKEAFPFYLKVFELKKEGKATLVNISKTNLYDELGSCYLQLSNYRLAITNFDISIQHCLKESSKSQNRTAYGILLAKKAFALYKVGEMNESQKLIIEATNIIRSLGNYQVERMLDEITQKMNFES